jgi:competence protein ComGC
MKKIGTMMGKMMKKLGEKRKKGVGVVEVILILVVLIALVILFKAQLTQLANTIFGDIFSKAESVF